MATEKRLKGYDPITLESFTRHMTKHREPYDQYDMGYVDAVEQIENFLENNTVDAVEVVHGRWVLAKPRVKGRNATYRCTACGKLRSSYYNDVFQWEYCPCGAKMDGDGNG